MFSHYFVQDWEWLATATVDVLFLLHPTGEWLLPTNHRYCNLCMYHIAKKFHWTKEGFAMPSYFC